MPIATDNGQGNGKKEYAAGAALNHIAGIGKVAGRVFKSRLNKNIRKLDPQAATDQDCRGNHEAF